MNEPKAKDKMPIQWKLLKLGDIVDIKSGDSPSNYNFVEDGTTPYIKVRDMNNCIKYQTDSRFYTNNENGAVSAGSIIFPKRGAAILNNKVRLTANPIFMDSNMMALSVKNDAVNNEFLYYKICEQKLLRIADTSTIPQINNKHIIPYKLKLPPLREQIRISQILSTWDQAIETTLKLINQMELRKKGLMQQLLFGKKRLLGFDGEWRTMEMNKLFNEIKDKNDEGIHEPLTISAKTGFVSQKQKFDKVIAGSSLAKYIQLRKGDFSYNKGNSKTYTMGCIYLLEKFDTAVVPFVYISFRPKKIISSGFYKFWFENHGLDRQLKGIISSGARGDGLLNVNKKDFFSLKVPFPPKDEQKAIALVFDGANTEIKLQSKYLESLKAQKKSLMQQLLTGKKRVKIDE